MEKIKVETSQNVAIEYSLANVGERLIANIFDYLIIGGYYLLAYFIAAVIDLSTNGAFWSIVSLLPLLYQLLCEIFLQGQSLGMRIRKIKVIRLDGKELSAGNCFLRWMLRPIDILISGGGVAVIAISVTAYGQRLGDIAAGTTVVKLKNELSLNDSVLKASESNYTPVFAQVSRLSDADIAVIQEVILRAEQTGNLLTAFATSKKLEGLLQIKNATPRDPIKFLKILIKDYYHITGVVA